MHMFPTLDLDLDHVSTKTHGVGDKWSWALPAAPWEAASAPQSAPAQDPPVQYMAKCQPPLQKGKVASVHISCVDNCRYLSESTSETGGLQQRTYCTNKKLHLRQETNRWIRMLMDFFWTMVNPNMFNMWRSFQWIFEDFTGKRPGFDVGVSSAQRLFAKKIRQKIQKVRSFGFVWKSDTLW